MPSASSDRADNVPPYLGAPIDPVQRLVNFSQNLLNGAAGFERFLEMMAVQPDIADAPDAAPLREIKGEVEFVHVGFRYAGSSNEVLSRVSLTVRPGETAALTGMSGAGKTTLCSPIPRFCEAGEGIIIIDGTDIKTVTLKSRRSRIGIVQQDVYLFTGTIRENLLYGKPGLRKRK